MQKKGLGLLLAAAAAAYGYYRFSRMTPAQKEAWKEKGTKFLDENFGSLGSLFGKKKQSSVNQI